MTDQKVHLEAFWFYGPAFVPTDIIESVSKFTVRSGVFPELGGLSADFTFPIKDTIGADVTVAVGDLLYPEFHGAYHNVKVVPMVAIVTSAVRTGDSLHIEAESIYAPMLRDVFTNSYSGSVLARTVFYDVNAQYSVKLWNRYNLLNGEGSLRFRAVTGGTDYTVDQTISDAVFNATNVVAAFQYLCELRAVAAVPEALSCAHPEYGILSNKKPDVKIRYTGYGNHRDAVTAANRVLTYDAGIISPVIWLDSSMSVLNDITTSVKNGAFYQSTDTSSISAYGRRQSKLIRNIYTSQASAQATSESLVAHLKVPKSRCTVTADYSYIFDEIDDTLNFVYTVTDDITGRSEEMTLRSFEIEWPSNVCRCTFENAALPMEQYNLRMENRVGSLESAVPNQTLDTTSSPTFVAITLDNTIDGTLAALADGSLQLDNSYGNFNFGPKNANYSYFITDRAKFAMNKPLIFYNTNTHDIGDASYSVRSLYLGTSLIVGGYTVIDASRNITCGSITPYAINVHDLGTQTNYWNECFVASGQFTSLRSMDIVSVDPCIQVAQGASHIWMRFRMSGASLKAGALFSSYDSQHFFMYSSAGDLKIDHNTTLDSAGAVNKLLLNTLGNLSITGDYYGGRLYLTSGANATDMGVINNTSATADDRVNISINRTNQSGTQLFLSIYDAKNSAFGGVMAKTFRLQGSVYGEMSGGANGELKVQTASGYVQIGPTNTSYCHLITDRGNFYTNKGLVVTGNVTPYQNGNFDLGATSLQWRSIYLVTGLYMGGTMVLDASRNLSINDLTVAGTCTGVTAIVPGVTSFNAAASANTRNSFDAVASFLPGAVYVKRKTITFTNGLGPGTYRVYFEAAVQAGGGIVYARVYKNGSAIGTARSTSSTTYTGWSQDFTGPLNPGDTIELWAYHSGDAGYYGYVRYFRVQYDLSLPTTMPSTNS